MIDNISHVDKQFAPLAIESDTAVPQRDAMQKQAAWFTEPQNSEKKLTFAAALRRWGRAACNHDAVEHADRLLAGEL